MEENVKVLNFGFVNAFLVKAKDGFVLIDSGLPMHWKRLEKELIDEGALPDRLKLLILTHGDRDHTGNAKNLQEKYHIKIAMHKDDYPMIDPGIYAPRKVKPLSHRIMYFILKLSMKLKKPVPGKNKFNVDHFLVDQERLDKFGFNAKIIHIPGHTKGSIAILTDDKDLFLGDTYVYRKKPETAIIIENETDLKSTIEKLSKLDVRTVYTGHGKPFDGKFLK